MKKITSLVLLAMSGAFLLASCGEQPAASSQPTGSPTDSSTPASQQVTVKFNTDGGSAIADVKVDKGTKVTKPADPTKEGYTFGKWYEDAAKVTEYDFDTLLSSDITLYASWVAATPSGSDSGSDSTPASDPNIIYFRESTWWNSATGYPMVSFDGAGVTPDDGKNKPDFDSGALVKAGIVKTVQESATAYYNYWSIDLSKHATATTIQLFKCGPHYDGDTPVEGTVEWWDAATTVITLADRGTNNMYDIHGVAKPGDSEWPAYVTGVWGTYDPSGDPTPSSSDSSTPAVDPSELDDITTKYGLKNTVTGKYLSGCDPMTDKDFQGRDQAKAADVSFKAGVTFSIVDHENADAVVPAELENATDLSGKVSVSGGVYTVLADFTADVYVKTKYQDDKIYIQVK